MKTRAILVFALAACGGNPGPEPTADGGWETFGAALPDGTWVQAASLLANPADYDGKTLLVEGSVDAVCKVKGCWLTIREGDTQMRVRFKDYGFFVPKDCEGRSVRLHGTFAVKTVPEAEAKHYLEDEGKHEEAAALQGDQRELSFLADGVRLKP